MRWPVMLAATMLAACGQPAEQAAEQPRAEAEPSATAAPLPAPESLVGEYRVAGIDGQPLDAPFGIALSISEGQVSFEPACAAFVWSYAYVEGRVDIERRREALDHPPPAACPEPVAPQLAQLATALDAVDRAGRTPENGIELSGNGRSVLLFSQ